MGSCQAGHMHEEVDLRGSLVHPLFNSLAVIGTPSAQTRSPHTLSQHLACLKCDSDLLSQRVVGGVVRGVNRLMYLNEACTEASAKIWEVVKLTQGVSQTCMRHGLAW